MELQPLRWLTSVGISAILGLGLSTGFASSHESPHEKPGPPNPPKELPRKVPVLDEEGNPKRDTKGNVVYFNTEANAIPPINPGGPLISVPGDAEQWIEVAGS